MRMSARWMARASRMTVESDIRIGDQRETFYPAAHASRTPGSETAAYPRKPRSTGGPPCGSNQNGKSPIVNHRSFAASPGGVKGTTGLIVAAGLTGLAPGGTVLDDPIRQRPLKADVVTGLLRFDPFMLQNFLALSQKLAIQRGILQQIVCRGCIFHSVRHSLHRNLRRYRRCCN